MIQVLHMMCLSLTQAFLARRIMIYSNNKTLHNLTITLPSDVDEKELGISLDQNIRFHPNITRDGYFLLLRMRTNKLLELERCSDAINEMNNARRGKQTTLSLILAEPISTLWKKH